jgi:N-acetylglucosaminyl-diphospho-decaprenol L-rhamnosyltransferase
LESIDNPIRRRHLSTFSANADHGNGVELSIVIVSWNTRDRLAECLRSLWANFIAYHGRCVETLVVDNASRDGTAATVRNSFPWVQLIENEENVGFAQANNQAIRRSSGRYLLLLNPDTAVKPGAIQNLLRFLKEHGQVGAAGARLLNADGSLQLSCYQAPSLSGEAWRLFHLDAVWPYRTYRQQHWGLDKPRPVEILLGACVMLRRRLVDQVGLLDEAYFMYSEEVDLCHRIRQAGWQIYWVPQAEVIHYGGQSTRQVAAEMFMQLYQGKLLFFRKHHGRSAALVYKLILVAAATARLLASPIAYLERPSRRSHHLHLAACYRRLLFSLPRL